MRIASSTFAICACWCRSRVSTTSSPVFAWSGAIRCTGECTAFWEPLAPGAGKPTGAAGAGKLGVIRRPDGARQVSVDGRPVYTFSEDTAGSITGDGFRDEFGGRNFLWHIVLAGSGPAPAATATATSGGGGGYGY